MSEISQINERLKRIEEQLSDEIPDIFADAYEDVYFGNVQQYIPLEYISRFLNMKITSDPPNSIWLELMFRGVKVWEKKLTMRKQRV